MIKTRDLYKRSCHSAVVSGVNINSRLNLSNKLEALANRLIFRAEEKREWIDREWFSQVISMRSPVDNGANIKRWFDGLRSQSTSRNILTQLAMLRSVEVSPDSKIFYELEKEVAVLGDPHVEALFRVTQARCQIYHVEQPDAILHSLKGSVAAALVVCSKELDVHIIDLIASYAALIGGNTTAWKVFESMSKDSPVGSDSWVITQLNLASVDILRGSPDRARRRYLSVTPYLANVSASAQNFAEWVDMLSRPVLGNANGDQLSGPNALVVRKRAMRRFHHNDLMGIVPVQNCVDEILVGIETDPVSGLAELSTLRSRLDESVAIGETVQLAAVRVPQLLSAANRLADTCAAGMFNILTRRFAASTSFVVARVDLDLYAVYGDMQSNVFAELLEALMREIRRPIALQGEVSTLLLSPVAQITTSVAGDTGFSMWERVFSGGQSAGVGIEVVSAPDIEDTERRYVVAQELLSASLAKYAELEFQPIVDIKHRRVHGFESLLRWNSPELGRVPPPCVVEVAKQCGALDRLERCIVTAAVAGAAALHTCDQSCKVNVNLSAAQLSNTSMVEFMTEQCRQYNVPTTAVAVELTESILINQSACASALELLENNGFATTLDDFGTGYSNLSYLVQMRNVDLKIDGSFVRQMLDEIRADTVCQMLIGAAASLGTSIVAEQVETDEQAIRLHTMGCSLHQGYRYAPSLPLERAMEVLREPTIFWQWPETDSKQSRRKQEYFAAV